MSKQHGMEMYQKKDQAHMAAMGKMQELMQKPAAMQKWFESKRKDFESLPENDYFNTVITFIVKPQFKEISN